MTLSCLFSRFAGSPCSAVHPGHGSQGRDTGRADIHAAQRFGTAGPEVFAVCLFDIFCPVLVAGIDQIAVIGEGCPVEGVAVDIIRAYFQAQAAFHALGSGILVGMVFIWSRAVFTDIDIGFLQVFLDGGTVCGQIDDSRELAQGFQHTMREDDV